MPTVANLAVSVTARINKFEKGFKRARRILKRFRASVVTTLKRLVKFGATMGAMAVGLAYGFARIAMAGERFNQKMHRSLAIMSGVTAKVRAEMKRTAFEVARTTTHSAEQAAESYFFLASAGLNAVQSIKALPTVAQFAQAGMFDMARATELLTDAQSALGLTVKDSQQNMLNMTRVGDVLVRANTLANASVQEFSEALTRKAAAAFKILGKDVEEVVAVLAYFADQGTKAAESGNALQIVLRELQEKAIDNEAAFKRVGVEVYNLATGRLRDMTHIIADLEDAVGNMTNRGMKSALMLMGFQARSVSFLQTLFGGSRIIHAYETALYRAGGTMKAVADKQLTPFEKSIARIGAAWVRLSDSLQPLVTVASHFISVIAGKMETLTGILTPEAVTRVFATILNRIDLFLRSVTHKLTVFSLAMNETIASIFEAIPMVGVPERIARNIETLQRDVARQSKFLIAARRGETQAVGQLWGEVARRAIEVPLREAMRRFHQEQKAAWRDTIAGAFEWAKFEWERLLAAPERTIMKWLGYRGPKELAAIENVATALAVAQPQRRITRFAEVSLSRQAVMGLNVRGLGGQLVRDPQLQETNRLLTQVADNTRSSTAFVGP